MRNLDGLIYNLENAGHYDKRTSLVMTKDLEKVIVYLKDYRDMLKGESAYKKGFEDGRAKQAHEDEVSRRWEESYRESQMPWNHYTEMGG